MERHSRSGNAVFVRNASYRNNIWIYLINKKIFKNLINKEIFDTNNCNSYIPALANN